MENISNKGISPLVATVLLIAATMSIAMILAFWASSFVKTSLPATNETQQKCQFSDFQIYQCTYNLTSSSLNVILQNLRSNPLDNMVVYLLFTNNSISDQYSLNGTLLGGTYKSYTLSNMPLAFSKIIVSSLTCAGIMPDKDQACTTVT
jgi:flagellin-like protein